MRTLLAALAAAAALSASGPAQAQASLATSASQLYDACIRNGQGGPTECACMAGFYGGRLREDEYRMISIINQYTDAQGNVPDMPGVQRALQVERQRMGMSEARFGQIMQRFTQMETDGAYGDNICVPLRNR